MTACRFGNPSVIYSVPAMLVCNDVGQPRRLAFFVLDTSVPIIIILHVLCSGKILSPSLSNQAGVLQAAIALC